MKKSKLLIPLAGIAALGATVAPLVTLSSCKENPTMVTVTFDYGLETEQVDVAKGGKVAKPADPKYDGFTFLGWYKDKGWEEEFDFDNDTISKSTTLYAAWGIKDVKSIELNTEGATRIYTYGDRFSLEGLIITATFEDGSRRVIPTWACTSDIPEGQKLTQHGFQDVTVTVGGVSRKYEILVNAAVTSMTVTPNIDLTDIAVGDTIYRRNFQVHCTYSDGSEGTLLPLQWQSNIFPDGALSYTFTEPGTKEIRITYADQEWTGTSYAYLDNDYELNLPTKFILPVSTSSNGNKYTSRKKITILSGTTPISTESLTYKIDSSTPVTDDVLEIRGGTIFAKKPTSNKYIKFTICDSNGTQIVSTPIEVKVVEDENVTIPTTGRVADFGAYKATEDTGVCVIPDAVSQNDVSYAINLVDGEDGALDQTKSLYLPNSLYSIEQYAISDAPKLQNIYFDGTVEEWNNIEKFSLWSNDFVTAVDCIGDIVPVDSKHAKAKYWFDESIAKFEFSTDPFANSESNTTLQFDFTGIAAVSLLTGIKLYEYTPGAAELKVFADGEQLVEYTHASEHESKFDYTWDETNKTITFNNDDATHLTSVANKNIVIKCPGLFSKNGYAACLSNILPVGIHVDSYFKVWHVGETFSKQGLSASWVWADGSTYKIPTELLDVNGVTISNVPFSVGHKFTKADRNTPEKQWTIATVTDKISALWVDPLQPLEATYQMQIND